MPDPQSYIEAARRCKQMGRLPEALDILKEGIGRCAPSVSLYKYYVERLEKCNRTEEAIAAAGEAARLFPDELIFSLSEALLLPAVYATPEELELYRRRYSEGLHRLCGSLSLDTAEVRRKALSAIAEYTNFYAGYQAGNIRESQMLYGGMLQRIMTANYPEWSKPLPMPPADEGKLRIGYVSSWYSEGSGAARVYLGWLREHTRQQFSLYTYYLGSRTDSVTEEVKRISNLRFLPDSLEDVCRAILADRLHVLVYLDMGLRAPPAQLASLRLAPVQCAAWDAPHTSGLPTLDYFLSSDLMEPADAAQHYSEQLIRLPGIGVCVRKPVIPTAVLTKTRRDFGLRDDAAVYLCCQSAAKYLPEGDDVLTAIARRVRNSQFVFLPNPLLADDLRARIERAFAAAGLKAADHVVVLRPRDLLTFWNLNLLSDVFLDTFHWSGGVTTLDAVACRLPAVTLPGKYMRGRHSYAILTQLGVTDTIARDQQEYIEIAARLGCDREWRESVAAQMVRGYPRLYSDTRCVRALEEFFEVAVAERLGQERT